MNEESWHLSWRGRQSGPFTRSEILTQLRQGEISGMHLVHKGGGWIPVEEFLDLGAPQPPPQPAAPRLTRKPEPPVPADRSADMEVDLTGRSGPPAAPYAPPPPDPHYATAFPRQRISALAVLAFIFSLTSWAFLFLWPLAAGVWLLSVIFGHTACADCARQPALTGRGLAIAALAITYLSLLLFLALVFVLRTLTL
jgi:hypothetical protein